MKAILYYYSGTGNTELVAKLYQKYFDEYETDLYKIHKLDEGETFPDPNDYDLVGIGFPIYGFNSPEPAFRFAQMLPKIEGEAKKAFIFKSSGEGLSLNNYAGQKIIACMSKKGYDFVCERHYVMPYNMIFRHSPEMVKSEFIYADALARLNTKQIEQGLREKVRYCPLRYWFVPIVRIVWPWARFQSKTMMKVRKDKCIKCNKCVKGCPMKNIHYDEKKQKYVFGGNCCLCVCCSFNCPKDAISINLLNGWRINGSYHIVRTASDANVEFPYFDERLKGLQRWLYYRYYRRLDKTFAENNIKLIIPTEYK